MSELPAGTFAYQWFDSGLGRNQVTLRSTGGSATYDTTMNLVGFTRDHLNLLVASGSSMRVYDIGTGNYELTSFGSTTTVHAIHPDLREVLVSRVPGTFVERYDIDTETYTDTSILKSGVGIMEYNPDGDILFVTRNVDPWLELYDATTLAPLASPYADVTGYIESEPRLAIAFNRSFPQVAMSVTGIRDMIVFDSDTGAYIWDVYNPDAEWAYWLSFNQTGDLISVASDAFSITEHVQILDADDGNPVRDISIPGATSFVHGVFTGDGDDIILCNHPTLADTVTDARTGSTSYTLLGDALAAVSIPPYVAPPVVDAFWTQRVKTQEII